ncbi:MAG: nucleotidyltransferase [Tannerellaceae bacterium]|jgi:NDP-sugar pyrophosphorylase family protein|nr:nucleotidyltransferase [Tannerellaceae bacterium]
MQKLTLLVLAAGIGTRFGSLKQLNPVGPHGETIMDYSIFDAIRAGFNDVVFVIRRDFEDAFRHTILPKYQNLIPTQTVFQDIDDLPLAFNLPHNRAKPWGTNHAILAARHAISNPFATINADDFYGAHSFSLLYDALAALPSDSENLYTMVAYQLQHTLSEFGTVSRGICTVSRDGFLSKIKEHRSISSIRHNQINTPVSMNLWGFTPDFFTHSQRAFLQFLEKSFYSPNNEFFIPTTVNNLIANQQASVKVLHTPDQWFGITFPNDRPTVVANLAALHASSTYPSPLF